MKYLFVFRLFQNEDYGEQNVVNRRPESESWSNFFHNIFTLRNTAQMHVMVLLWWIVCVCGGGASSRNTTKSDPDRVYGAFVQVFTHCFHFIWAVCDLRLISS